MNWNNLVSIKCHPENRDKIPSQLPHVLLSNIRSLVLKFDELSMFLMLNRADLVAISETWLNEQIDSSFVSITGYDLYRLDRLSGRGGGVCAFVSNNIPCKRRLDLENANYECMWLWLRPYRLPRPLSAILIAVLYLNRQIAGCGGNLLKDYLATQRQRHPFTLKKMVLS